MGPRVLRVRTSVRSVEVLHLAQESDVMAKTHMGGAIVARIPNEAWDLLDTDEQDLLLLVDDFLEERHSLAKFSARLDALRRVRSIRQENAG